MTNTPAETVERQAIADELSKALVERNVSRYEAIAFVRRHEIIAALTAPAPSASVAGEAMLRQALEDIINPLGYLRREAEAQGNQLGGMAYQIASDPSMSRTIAKRALADYAALPSKPDAHSWPGSFIEALEKAQRADQTIVAFFHPDCSWDVFNAAASEDILARGYQPKPDTVTAPKGERAFPEAADGTPTIPGEVELWAAGCDLETAKFAGQMLIQQGYRIVGPLDNESDLVEHAVQAALDAGLAEDGKYGVAAARHAARFILASTTPARLLEGNEALKRALEPFATYARLFDDDDDCSDCPDHFPISRASDRAEPTIGDCRRARAALGGETR